MRETFCGFHKQNIFVDSRIYTNGYYMTLTSVNLQTHGSPYSKVELKMWVGLKVVMM